MGRRSAIPLEKIKLRLYEGDFQELSTLLSPRRISATLFIRALVRNALRNIKAKANLEAKPIAEHVEVDLDGLQPDDEDGEPEPSDGNQSNPGG